MHTPNPAQGKAEEVASIMLFLASDMASYVNGQLIKVDDEMLSHLPHAAQQEECMIKASY